MRSIHGRAAALAALVLVALVAAGLGAYFGIRAAGHGGGSATSGSGPTPPARTAAAMAFDPERGQVVLFGGMGAGAKGTQPLGDTWTWDGTSWTQQHPAASPPAAALGLMAYDPTSRRVLLLTLPEPGGPVASSGGPQATQQAQTWLWDGSGWQRYTGEQPPVSFRSTIATDTASHAVILVAALAGVPGPLVPCRSGPEPAEPLPATGCPGIVAPRLATWAWNGSAWHDTGVAPPTTQWPAGPEAAVTDPTSGHAELFTEQPSVVPLCVPQPLPTAAPRGPGAPAPAPCVGVKPPAGAVPAVVPHMSITRWTGTQWSSPQTLAPPDEGRGGGSFVPDTAAHRVLYIAPSDGSTWAFDGTWTKLPATLSTPGRQASTAVAPDGRPLLFGGFVETTGTAPGVSSETWTWDGAAWHQHGGSVTHLALPSATASAGVVTPATAGAGVAPSAAGSGGSSGHSLSTPPPN